MGGLVLVGVTVGEGPGGLDCGLNGNDRLVVLAFSGPLGAVVVLFLLGLLLLALLVVELAAAAKAIE